MIRKGLKRLARKALGRERTPTPATPPPVQRPLPPSEPEPEPIDLEVDGAQALALLQDEDNPALLLDIREVREIQGGHAKGAFLLPMNQVPQRLAELPPERTIVIYCAAGARSYGVAHYLRENGFDDAWSLAGGLGALSRAGADTLMPDRKAEFQVLDAVRVSASLLAERGLALGEGDLPASIQQVDFLDEAFVYALRVAHDGGSTRIDGVAGEHLSSIGRR